MLGKLQREREGTEKAGDDGSRAVASGESDAEREGSQVEDFSFRTKLLGLYLFVSGGCLVVGTSCGLLSHAGKLGKR